MRRRDFITLFGGIPRGAAFIMRLGFAGAATRCAGGAILLASLVAGLASSAWSEELTETPGPLLVTIGGNTVKLDGLVIKKSDAQGRLPIVVFTNGGQPTATAGLSAVNTATYAPYARDLARRGWLAAVALRRGFGKSEGAKPSPITCEAASLDSWASAAADDLQAVIDLIAQRDDADASKVMVIGSEIAGVAAVALSARNPPGLVGVISLSGGLQAESKCPMQDILAQAFKGYGSKSRVPNLWMYAKSDKAFDPDFAERLHAAFLDGGGDLKFMMFYRIGDTGSAIFSQARAAWLTQMDGFLQLSNLPTWKTTDAEDIATKLKITDPIERASIVEVLQSYLAAPGEKALAFSPSMQAAYVAPVNNVVAAPPLPVRTWTGAATIVDARKGALTACQKNAQDCAVALENFTWVGAPP
jgi:dienelactone hydrolase